MWAVKTAVIDLGRRGREHVKAMAGGTSYAEPFPPHKWTCSNFRLICPNK